jgi:hypothetical protein
MGFESQAENTGLCVVLRNNLEITFLGVSGCIERRADKHSPKRWCTDDYDLDFKGLVFDQLLIDLVDRESARQSV